MFPDINVIDTGRIDIERKRDAHHAKTKLAALQYSKHPHIRTNGLRTPG